MRLSRDDVRKYRPTVKCPGCEAAMRGSTAQNHTEQCRKRLEECIEKNEKDRYDKEMERLTRRYAEAMGEKLSDAGQSGTSGAKRVRFSTSHGEKRTAESGADEFTGKKPRRKSQNHSL